MSIFQIDHNKIASILKKTHVSLLHRRDQIIEKTTEVPEQLQTDQDLKHAKDAAVELNEAKAAARQARLSDQRPFREASATVQEFFDDVEKPLQDALKTILDRVADAARGRRSNILGTPATPHDTVGTAEGIAIVTNPSLANVLGPEIELVWAVKSIDRATVDLDQLRNYLTDACLRVACRKHLQERGPNTIAGVVYQEAAQPTGGQRDASGR